MSDEAIIIRKMTKEDEPFIYATYLKNNWYDEDNTSTLKKETWFKVMHGRLEKLLTKVPVAVACLSTEPEVILGYGVADKECYVYLRPSWRAEELNLHNKIMNALKE